MGAVGAGRAGSEKMTKDCRGGGVGNAKESVKLVWLEYLYTITSQPLDLQGALSTNLNVVLWSLHHVLEQSLSITISEKLWSCPYLLKMLREKV